MNNDVNMDGFSEELKKLKVITNKLTENGYLVDRTAQWEFAFDAVQDLVLIVNPNMEIKFINKAFAERLNVDRTTIVNNNTYCYNIVQCPNCQKDPGDCLLSHATKPNVERGDIYIEDHLQGWFNFTHSPIHDDNENLLGFICVLNDITERKQAEEELRKSEERYRQLFNSTGTATFVASEDMAVVEANTKCEQLVGYTIKEVIEGNMKLTDFLVDKERGKKMHYGRRDERVKVPSEYEIDLIDRYGNIKHVFVQANMLPESNQSVASVIDITTLKETEVALRDSEARYADLYDNAPDMFVSVDADTTLINRCNQTLVDNLGYTKEEIIGQPIFFVYAPDSIEKAKKTFNKFVETGEVKDVHMKLQKKNGDKIDVSLNVTSVKDETGKIIRSRSSWRDIADQIKTQEKLRKSEEKYRNIYETAPLAFVVWNYDAEIIDWNKNAEIMFGYTKEEVEGKNFFDFIIPKTSVEHVKKVVDFLRLGEVTSSINENITKDGDMILCEWHNSIYHDCSGKPTGFISLALDITEMRAKEELIKSIFKASPAGIGLIKDRVFQWTNKRFRDMVGYSEEELINQSARMLYQNDEEFERVGAVKYARLDKNGFGYVKTTWQKKDGELVDILLSSAYVDENDHSKGATFTATDIIIWD